MRIKNLKKTIKYLVFSILLCAGLFISFGKTVNANEYIRYQSVDSDALAEWIKYKNEHEENNYTTVYVPQSESKNDSNNKSNATIYRIFPILYILVIVAANILWLYFKKAPSESSELYEIDIDPTDDDYSIDLTNDDYKIEDSVEETDLIDISLEPVQNKVMSEYEKIESAVEVETIKELSSRELKEIVKNLDTIEKSKFITPAKNGKKEEAIEICKEVTGLDQKNAEKIINLKLYY